MKKHIFFKKMQALGNDFIIIDSQKNPTLFFSQQINLERDELSFLANRNYGIGCDQILIVTPSTSRLAQFDYLIYNQDGNPALFCANGARCVIKYLATEYNLTKQITLNTLGKLTTGSIALDNKVKIQVGVPDIAPKSSGYTQEINPENNYSFSTENNSSVNFSIVSIGNPHAVIFLKDLSSLNNSLHLEKIAKAIQKPLLFNHGVNVNFGVITSPNQIHLRTYERGVGFTQSCGSGASATASIAILYKNCNSQITVHMPGGTLKIQWDQINELEMTGGAQYVFEGSILL